MVELKDRQQQGTKGELQLHSCLTLTARVLVPYCVQFYVPSWKNDPVTSRWSSFYLIIDDILGLKWRYYTNCTLQSCCCLVALLCLTFCDRMDCSLAGSSVHGISQDRILEWVSSSGDLTDPGIEPASPVSPAFLTASTTREASCYLLCLPIPHCHSVWCLSFPCRIVTVCPEWEGAIDQICGGDKLEGGHSRGGDRGHDPLRIWDPTLPWWHKPLRPCAPEL